MDMGIIDNQKVALAMNNDTFNTLQEGLAGIPALLSFVLSVYR
jgi:hypothetical protein